MPTGNGRPGACAQPPLRWAKPSPPMASRTSSGAPAGIIGCFMGSGRRLSSRLSSSTCLWGRRHWRPRVRHEIADLQTKTKRSLICRRQEGTVAARGRRAPDGVRVGGGRHGGKCRFSRADCGNRCHSCVSGGILAGAGAALERQGRPAGVYQGTNFTEVAAAQTLGEFLDAIGKTITQVRATDPPRRMEAIANQIAAAAPTLVSLQELAQWSTRPFDQAAQTCGPVATEFDMRQALANALAGLRAAFTVAYEAIEVQIPPTPGLLVNGQFLCVAMTNHVAILARTDLGSEFSWSNPQSGQYDAKIFFNS